MMTWISRRRGWILACVGAAAALSLAACGTVKGVGEDLSGVSDSARMAIFGGDPDRAPVD